MSLRHMSIRARVALGSFVFAFFPLLVLGFILFRGSRAEMVSSTGENQVSLVLAIDRQIESIVKDDLDGAVRLASLTRTEELALRIRDGKGREDALGHMRSLLASALIPGGSVERYLYLDATSGEVLAATDPHMEGMSFGKRPYFIAGREKPVLYRLHYAYAIEKNVMAAAAPVRRGGRTLGVIVCWFNIRELTDTLVVPPPARAYLVTRQNLFVPAGVESGEAPPPILSGVFTEGAERALAGETGSAIYRGRGGEEVVGAFTHIESLDLALLVEIPTSYLSENTNRLGRKILGITLGIALVVLAMAIVVGRQIAYPLTQLAESITAYGEGKDKEGIAIDGGSMEVSRLTRSFNRMIELRREAEVALRESEEKFRTLVNQASDCIHLIEPREGGPVIVDVNEYSCRLHGYTREEMVGQPINMLDAVWDKEKGRSMAADILAGKVAIFEVDHRRKDGSVFPVEVSARSVTIGGRPFILAIERDITERRQAEERMMASLSEKEVLLKEIHHRVKNNMQIISSLLKLQSSYVEDPLVADMFRESLDRIKSMALIHEKLYLSRDFSRINYREYLASLAGRLLSYATAGQEIELDIQGEALTVGMDVAIPCGLVVNELVSNAIKHGFAGSASGTITVSFARAASGEYELRVRDTGRGLPEGFDPHAARSMGMMLVTSIVEGQLRGTVRASNPPEGGGAEFVLRFGEPEYSQRL